MPRSEGQVADGFSVLTDLLGCSSFWSVFVGARVTAVSALCPLLGLWLLCVVPPCAVGEHLRAPAPSKWQELHFHGHWDSWDLALILCHSLWNRVTQPDLLPLKIAPGGPHAALTCVLFDMSWLMKKIKNYSHHIKQKISHISGLSPILFCLLVFSEPTERPISP